MSATTTTSAERPAGGMPLLAKVRYIAALWRPHRRWLALLALFTAISGGVTVVYPLVLKETIDAAAQAGVGAQIFLILAAIWVGRFVAGFYPALRAYMNLRIESALRAEVFSRIVEKDYRFRNRFRTGDLVTRLTDDIGEYPKIAWFCCSGIFRAVDAAGKAFLSIGAMFLLDAKLALISIAPLPFMLGVYYIARARFADAIERQQRAISRTNDHLEAAFSGIKIVKAFAAEDGQRRRLAEILRQRIPAQLRTMRLQVVIQAIDALAARVGQALALAIGGLHVARGEIEFGTLYAFYVYLDMLVHPLQDLPMLLVSARQAFVSVDRLEAVRNFPAPPRAPEGEPLAGPIREVAARDLAFTFEGAAEPALDGVSFSVRAGERVAVAGAVGCGKSTLARVLVGLLPADRGDVLVDGRPVREVGWRAFRARVGYVPQEPHLFSMTVRENVALASADGAASIDTALATAQLADDPELAEKEVGAKGGSISGGQRQRVAIARALARRPALLVLDDATAALDAQNEDRFWTHLDRDYPDLATVVVTSRLASLRRATRVLLMERGRIVDEGTHEELAARSAAYRDLLVLDGRADRLAALPAG